MNGTFFRAMGLAAFGGLLGIGAAGCSVDLSQVFVSGNGGSPTSTGGSSAGGGGASTGGASTGGTTSMGGSTMSTTSSTSMTTSSTTTTTSSSTTTTTSSTTTSNTSTDPTGTLPCGDQSCQAPQDLCCWDKWGIGTGNFESGQCQTIPINAGDCNTNIENGGVQTLILCTDTAQCPGGKFCCGDVVQFNSQQGQISYYPKVDCRDTCDWPSRIMCSQPNDPICPQGTTCKQSQLLPNGVLVCGM